MINNIFGISNDNGSVEQNAGENNDELSVPEDTEDNICMLTD